MLSLLLIFEGSFSLSEMGSSATSMADQLHIDDFYNNSIILFSFMSALGYEEVYFKFKYFCEGAIALNR